MYGEVRREMVLRQLRAAARVKVRLLLPLHPLEPAPEHDGCLAVMRIDIERCSNESNLQQFQKYAARPRSDHGLAQERH